MDGKVSQLRAWWRDPANAPVRRIVFGLAVVQGLLICGHIAIFLARDTESGRQILDFNQEWSLPTIWSAVVVAGAAVMAFRIRAREGGVAWAVIGLGLAGIAGEELISLHEHLEETTGIDWPILYAPAMVLGVWAVSRARHSLPAVSKLLIVAGVSSMVAAVGLEVVGDLMSGPTGTRNLIEENLELLGSGTVLVALRSAIRD